MKKSAAVFFIAMLLISLSSARYIRDIETDPEELEPGDSFTVIAELRDTTWAKTIKFYFIPYTYSQKK